MKAFAWEYLSERRGVLVLKTGTPGATAGYVGPCGDDSGWVASVFGKYGTFCPVRFDTKEEAMRYVEVAAKLEWA